MLNKFSWQAPNGVQGNELHIEFPVGGGYRHGAIVQKHKKQFNDLEQDIKIKKREARRTSAAAASNAISGLCLTRQLEIQSDLDPPSLFLEEWQKHSEDKQQWLLEHKDEVIREYAVADYQHKAVPELQSLKKEHEVIKTSNQHEIPDLVREIENNQFEMNEIIGENKGITPEEKWYHDGLKYVAVVLLAMISDTALVFSSLMDLENVMNAILIPLTLSMSGCLVISAHQSGIAVHEKSWKAGGLALGLGMLSLLILGYFRYETEASMVILGFNAVSWGVTALVSYLRHHHLGYFSRKERNKQLAKKKSAMETAESKLASTIQGKEAEWIDNCKVDAIEKYRLELTTWQNTIISVKVFRKVLYHYGQKQRERIYAIEQTALSDLGQ